LRGRIPPDWLDDERRRLAFLFFRWFEHLCIECFVERRGLRKLAEGYHAAITKD
jgi:hypothetical protein